MSLSQTAAATQDEVYPKDEFLRGIQLYFDRRYREFDAYLDAIPKRMVLPFMRELVGLVHSSQDPDMLTLTRRIGMKARFKGILTSLPSLYNQAVFFTNLPQLKTRVCMSFFDHPDMRDLEIDYSIVAFDQDGKFLFEKHATILSGQTHTFYVDRLLEEFGQQAAWGTFYVKTAYYHLASLRIYAFWYNDIGMTTTHEKGALANGGDLIIYPTVVSDGRRETFLIFPNLSDKEVKIACQLYDTAGRQHPQCVTVNLKPRAATFLPISQYFSDCAAFLAGRPGVIYAVPDPAAHAMYYYCIHDRKTGTWQIQHT